MTIGDYLQTVKGRLLADPLVVSFQIIRERVTLSDGYLRARLVLDDQSYLEFAEYVHSQGTAIQVVTYSYHWATSEDQLIRRWDNTPHFPNLSNFPHHIHERDEVLPGHPVDIFVVLNTIKEALNMAD